VGKGVVVEREVPERVGAFRPPSGVITALDVGPRASLETGMVERVADEALVVEAVAEGPDARERFLSVVERLPVVDNIEVRVADHYDAGETTDVWLSPRMRDTRRAIRFLDDFDVELLRNGHVDVSVYVRSPRSTWRLSQHKTLVWMTVDQALHEKVRGWLSDAGLARRDTLETIADRPHHHYRPATSSPRLKLGVRLTRAGLRKVDTIAHDGDR
ncbi:MAG: hypothetical protein K8M05_22100, partial [Deltaproteobacteria bacterium]|nr:hypothetical protein [Kofleriaceae bacterium]